MGMRQTARIILSLALMLFGGAPSHAASLEFKPRELFRIPFGKEPGSLGARLEGGNFIIPRTFSIDNAGHFYIDDTNKRRIARYSPAGAYQMEFRYLATARQVFAQPDSRENLWLLISDPAQGMYYGVFDPQGRSLRSGIFSRFNQFILHLDDDGTLRVILTSEKDPATHQTYVLDEKALLMKKLSIARPPENHHEIRHSERTYYMDPLPGASQGDGRPVTRITDPAHRAIADIPGDVIYITGRGEIYTRTGPREIRIYDLAGFLKGKITLKGLRSACSALRFDSNGSLYELDGIPDQSDDDLRRAGVTPGGSIDFEDLHYTPAMTGMRLIQWERINR